VPSDDLHLEAIRAQRLPGAQLQPDGSFGPIFTAVSVGPEISHYLVDTVDEAIALLLEARVTAEPDLQVRIDGFVKTV
jgi:hypothetical protein